jgi:hypothetical protein
LPVRERGFSFLHYLQMDMGHIQSHNPGTQEALSLDVNRPEHRAADPPPARVEVKNAWSYTRLPMYLHDGVLSQAQK